MDGWQTIVITIPSIHPSRSSRQHNQHQQWRSGGLTERGHVAFRCWFHMHKWWRTRTTREAKVDEVEEGRRANQPPDDAAEPQSTRPPGDDAHDGGGGVDGRPGWLVLCR